ncbi:MAG: acyl-CoA mutase large subunit family protein, partial [Oceanipulchritudo sp.]
METENNRRLLEEFAPHSYEEWKEAAVQLLKGRSFEKTLFTPTYEGFSLEPIYTGETVVDFPGQADPPGMGTRVRGSRIEGYLGGGWLISQELSAPTARELNGIALKELENGQNELNIWLDLPSRSGRSPQADDRSPGVCGLSLSTAREMRDLLEGIHPEMISLYFQSGRSAPALYALLLAAVAEGGSDPAKLSGCLGMDPLGWLAERGEFPGERARTYDIMSELIRFSEAKTPGLQIVDVQGHAYHNNGASSVQEMAALLATAVTYVREMTKRGLSAGEVVSRMRLSASIGGNFFLEIAKFRALRLLWNRVMEAFDVPQEARRVHLHARTGQWNKTLFDPYVNMLRTTTEAFSAVAGGCDSLHVAPFDEILRESDAFSRRIARNTHAILAEECGMTQVIDPGGGSWSVESLTDKMAAEAWRRFQDIESRGGMTEVLKTGWFAEAVASVREERRKNIQRRKDVILGTNTYPHPGESLPPSRKIDYTAIGKGLHEPLADR